MLNNDTDGLFLHLKITVMENVILDKIDDDVATRTCVVVVMPDKTYGVTYNKCDEAAVLSMFVVVTTLRNNVTMLINSEAMIVVVNVMIPIANEEISRSRRVIQCCSGRVGVSIWLALRRLIIVHTGIEGNDDLIPEVAVNFRGNVLLVLNDFNKEFDSQALEIACMNDEG